MQHYLSLATEYDKADELKVYAEKFHRPHDDLGQEKIYFCGHSLGLQPKLTAPYISEELDAWAKLGVEGHFTAKNPWLSYHETVTEQLAKLVGAKASEVIAMNSLTTNLHLMMVSFYRPTKSRYKILVEAGAFPSDRYAVQSHLHWHDKSIEDAYLEIPCDDQGLIQWDQLEKILKEEGDSIALILLPGVQFSTGQVLPMQKLTQLAHKQGAVIGLDLAHAIGNVPLMLHEWKCDFAIWCHYKYLNSGPGAIGGCFVHERHLSVKNRIQFSGWWGQEKSTRFQMPEKFSPIESAEAWQLSNPPIFQLAALRASLQLFSEVGLSKLRAKSLLLTKFARDMLQDRLAHSVKVITPVSDEEHGAQLSLQIQRVDNAKLVEKLREKNIVCDFRPPNIIRIAPVPFYNSFMDIYKFVEELAGML